MTRRHFMKAAAVTIGIGAAGMLFLALKLAAATDLSAILATVAFYALAAESVLLWREA